MVVAFFALFSQIAAMVLLISPAQNVLECCACAQIESLEGNRWLCLVDAGDWSERGRNAANLINDGGGLFLPFNSNTKKFRTNFAEQQWSQ